VTGTQSGYSSTSASPFFLPIPSATSPNTADVYVRSFNGMYAYFIQRIAKTKHEISVKYEWYDPNTKVKGNDIAGSTSNALSSADIKYTQLGFTYLYYFDANVKFMANYNIITNESTKLAGYTKDLKDNVLTLRVQYRF
jgi:hypothetical protein